ncbi:RRP15-like protein [Trichomycterus rosablanca]|uniref:RRP15-like protein n=1 Tax=Trichomycterus rosablanca TaxID=2290929 RepID=UPI002F3533E0
MMAASVKMPHVVVTDKDSDDEDINENPEESEEESADRSDDDGSEEDETQSKGSSDGGDEDGSDEEGSADEQVDGEEAEDETEGNDDAEENANAGWAAAMAKILAKKTPEDKPCILLKNKQRDKLTEKEQKEKQQRKKKADKKRKWEMMSRVKPDVVQDKERERNLQRIATRGVVQLFNAVRQHQKNVDDKMKEVGGSERKKAKVLSTISKKDFIDVLKGSAGCNTSVRIEKSMSKEPKEEKPAWSVLRDDFMMGAAMKDWDKESDKDEAGDDEPEAAGDFNSDSD